MDKNRQLFIGIAIGIICGVLFTGTVLIEKRKRLQQQIIDLKIKNLELADCPCISYIEYRNRQEKYELYVDSLVMSSMSSNKERTKRLQDSVTKSLEKLYF